MSGNAPAPSAAEVALSNDFASNKGRLPWPVTYNKVAREYGKYTHSSGGQNMNNGIDLVCASGAAVKSVFGGTVTRVFTCGHRQRQRGPQGDHGAEPGHRVHEQRRRGRVLLPAVERHRLAEPQIMAEIVVSV